MASRLSPMPFPDLPIRPPKKTPKPGHVVVGYEVVRGQGGCCKCDDLKVEGWVGVGICCIFCFPCAWIPCCITSCHEDYQRRVYGLPSDLPIASNQPPPGQHMPMMPGVAPQVQVFRIPSLAGPTAPTNAPVGSGTPYPQEPMPTFYGPGVAQGIPVNPPPSNTKGHSPTAPPMNKI